VTAASSREGSRARALPSLIISANENDYQDCEKNSAGNRPADHISSSASVTDASIVLMKKRKLFIMP